MNCILFALALLVSLFAGISVGSIMRVTFGLAVFQSTGAMWSHILTVAVGGTLAAWLFRVAFA